LKNAEIVELRTEPENPAVLEVGSRVRHYVKWRCPYGCHNYRLRYWLDYYDESKRGWENVYYDETIISSSVPDVIETMVLNRPLNKPGKYRFLVQIGFWTQDGAWRQYDQKYIIYSFALKPKARIVKAGILRDNTILPPGEYEISTFDFILEVQNTGSDGKVFARILGNGKELKKEVEYLQKDQKMLLKYSGKVTEKIEIKAEAGHYSNGKEIVDDRRGCR